MSADLELEQGSVSYAQVHGEPDPWWAGIDLTPVIVPVGANRGTWELAANFNFDVTMEKMVTLVGSEVYQDEDAFRRPVRRWRGGANDGRIDLLGNPRTDSYGLVSPEHMFDFAETLVELSDGKAYIANVGSIRNGNRSFISVNLGNNTIVAPNGWADESTGYLSISNSYDGYSPFSVLNGGLRIVCANTNAVQLANVKFIAKEVKGNLRGNFINGRALRLKHTINVRDRIEEGLHAIAEHNEWVEAYNVYAQKLLETKLTNKQFDQLVRDLILGDEDQKGGKIFNERKYDRAYATWNKESKDRAGANAFSALQVVTDLTSHFSLAKGTTLDPTSQISIQLGFDATKRNKATDLVNATNTWFSDRLNLTV